MTDAEQLCARILAMHATAYAAAATPYQMSRVIEAATISVAPLIDAIVRREAAKLSLNPT